MDAHKTPAYNGAAEFMEVVTLHATSSLGDFTNSVAGKIGAVAPAGAGATLTLRMLQAPASCPAAS